MRFLLSRVAAFCLLLLGFTSWSSAPAQANTQPPQPPSVVASFSILADLVSAIGGDHVTVHTLIDREQDGHVFQPRPSQLRQLQQADLVVVNGLGFEGWLARALQAAAHEGVVVVATENVEPLYLSAEFAHQHGHAHGAEPGAHPHEHSVRQPAHEHELAEEEPNAAKLASETPDPHAWQDPQRVQQYVLAIAEGLARVDPERADRYRQRAEAYVQQLAELDAWIEAQLAPYAAQNPTFVIPHAALQYYAERYGVNFLPAQGVAGGEASAQRLAELIRLAESAGTAGIVVEGPSVPAVMRQLAAESGLPVVGRLYSDTLSAPGGPANSYLEMMRHNTQVLVEALAAVPASGL